jgi:hypothetical protein
VEEAEAEGSHEGEVEAEAAVARLEEVGRRAVPRGHVLKATIKVRRVSRSASSLVDRSIVDVCNRRQGQNRLSGTLIRGFTRIDIGKPPSWSLL